MEPDIVVITDKITKKEIVDLAKKRFGDMVKGVVDISKEIMALGGELHADEEQVLLDRGSSQKDLWGINIYHAMSRGDWVEFDSMINIRPSQGNRSRSVENEEIRKKIVVLVDRMITD
ncbi:MAG TPA: DUF5674 family protein [Candidatus Peribacteraceae bacterium]|nr:DUF5674 family protein [Candidatus Peribacteraceae bacterium]